MYVCVSNRKERIHTLNGSQADTARSGVHEDRVALLDARADDQCAVAGRGGDEQARGLLEGPAVGDGQQGDLRGAEARGKGALAGAKDAGADGVLGEFAGRLGRGDDDACELGAGDPGEGFYFLLAKFLFFFPSKVLLFLGS